MSSGYTCDGRDCKWTGPRWRLKPATREVNEQGESVLGRCPECECEIVHAWHYCEEHDWRYEDNSFSHEFGTHDPGSGYVCQNCNAPKPWDFEDDDGDCNEPDADDQPDHAREAYGMDAYFRVERD